jgi:hypothetical protein
VGCISDSEEATSGSWWMLTSWLGLFLVLKSLRDGGLSLSGMTVPLSSLDMGTRDCRQTTFSVPI